MVTIVIQEVLSSAERRRLRRYFSSREDKRSRDGRPLWGQRATFGRRRVGDLIRYVVDVAARSAPLINDYEAARMVTWEVNHVLRRHARITIATGHALRLVRAPEPTDAAAERPGTRADLGDTVGLELVDRPAFTEVWRALGPLIEQVVAALRRPGDPWAAIGESEAAFHRRRLDGIRARHGGAVAEAALNLAVRMVTAALGCVPDSRARRLLHVLRSASLIEDGQSITEQGVPE